MKSATRLLPLFLFLFVFSSTSQALFAQGSGTTLIIAEEGDLVTTDEIELGLMCEPNLTDSGRIFFRNLQFPSEHKRVVPNTRSVSNRRSSPTAFLKHEWFQTAKPPVFALARRACIAQVPCSETLIDVEST